MNDHSRYRLQLSSIHDELTAQRLDDAQHEFITKTLSPLVAANATYIRQDKHLCHPDTRTDIHRQISEWAFDTSDDAKPLLWLTGVPGSGKSSITASVTSNFEDAGLLWAQFFVSRNDASTANPKSIFPSIALQLAHKSPAVGHVLHNTLKEKPTLANYISDYQALKLFVEPIKVASNLSSLPIVVVIDALDECDTTHLSETAEVISKLIIDLPHNAKVFISSRVEDDIHFHFSSAAVAGLVECINLDTSATSSIRDVDIFLREQITQIVEGCRTKLCTQPGEERVRILCDQASGLFIWAATAAKFIRSRIKEHGPQYLVHVLDELTAVPLKDINKLYCVILQHAYADDADDWVFERFRRVVGCIVVLFEPLHLAGLRDLLDLWDPKPRRRTDVEYFIRQFRTVLVAGTDEIGDKTVPRLHRSFFEFITSENAGRFRVDTSASNHELAVQCLHQLNGLTRDICQIEHLAAFNDDIPDLPTRIEKYFRPELHYACRFWSFHLPQVRGGTGSVALPGSPHLSNPFRGFLTKHLLHWIEAISLLDYSSVPLLLERATKWANVGPTYAPTVVDIH